MSLDHKDELKKFIAERFLKGRPAIADNQSLFAANIIDSFGMLELIAYIEKNFNIRVMPSEIDIDNFDTLDKIAALVAKKKDGVKP